MLWIFTISICGAFSSLLFQRREKASSASFDIDNLNPKIITSVVSKQKLQKFLVSLQPLIDKHQIQKVRIVLVDNHSSFKFSDAWKDGQEVKTFGARDSEIKNGVYEIKIFLDIGLLKNYAWTEEKTSKYLENAVYAIASRDVLMLSAPKNTIVNEVNLPELFLGIDDNTQLLRMSYVN